DTWKAFPRGGGDWWMGLNYKPDGSMYGPDKQTAGWCMQILPFIEQENLQKLNGFNTAYVNTRRPYPANGNSNVYFYNAREIARGGFDPGSYMLVNFHNLEPGPLRSVPIKLFYCPSRRGSDLYKNGGPWRTTLTDYCAATPGPAPIRRNRDG